MCLWINVPELGERMNFRYISQPRRSKMLNRCLDDMVKVAEEDIHCYKVLKPSNCIIDGKPLYRTPYQYMAVEFDKEIESDRKIKVDSYHYATNSIAILYGIHMFTSLDLALVRSSGTGYEVFDCIIPKGTRYVLGDKCDAVAEKVIIRKLEKQ